jgi:hypothetical protein
MRKVFLALVLMTTACAAQAEVSQAENIIRNLVGQTIASNESLLRNDNFESVWSIPSNQDCPYDDSEMSEILQAEFLRARLKDMNWAITNADFDFDEFGSPAGIFYFNAICLAENEYSKRWIYNLELRYFSSKNAGFNDFPTIRLAGRLGKGSEDAIRDATKYVVEEGLTEYLKANVD